MSSNSESIVAPGDFFGLLEKSGYRWHAKTDPSQSQNGFTVTHGTTVLAFHFKDGVIVAGDRRATAGNSIMYEECDKVIPIDDYTLMAIAGVPASAFELGRGFTLSFIYFSETTRLRRISYTCCNLIINKSPIQRDYGEYRKPSST